MTRRPIRRWRQRRARAQRGVAIVLAMGVVALAVMAASSMLVSQSTAARQSELASDQLQAQMILRAGVDWTRALLSDDRRASMVDHLGEVWAMRVPPVPIENGELAGYIDDQQGLFNLNNMVKGGKIEPIQLARFRRLLELLELPDALADALADWMDMDDEARPGGGAEDAYYASLQPPYLAANRPLADIEELALVRGYDENVRARLRPFVSALPRPTALNVNTAPPEVLAASVDGLKLADARALVAQRERTYFRTPLEFLGRLPRGISADAGSFGVSSDFFLATMRVTFGGAEARGLVLFAREDTRWPAILWRKYQ